MYLTGSHLVQCCIVCSVLLRNCLLSRASPTRFADWPRLKIFGAVDPRPLVSTIHYEMRRTPAMLTPPSPSPPSPLTTSSSTSSGAPSSSPSSPSPSSPLSSSIGTASHLTSSCSGCRLQNRLNADFNDQGGSEMMSAAEREYRIQVLKKQILVALDLQAPPPLKEKPPKIDPEIIEKVFVQSEKQDAREKIEYDNDDEVLRTDKQFILGVAGEARSHGNEHKAKLSFALPTNVQQASFVRGKLWLKVSNTSSATKRSLIVKQKLRRKYYVTHVIGMLRMDGSESDGWVSIELSSSWWSTRESTVVMEVVVDSSQPIVNVSAGSLLEVHVVRSDNAHRHRARRGINCQSSNPSACCLQSFSVTLDWDFIVHPNEIAVNYCRGSCDNGSNHIYNHSSVMYTRSMSETNISLRARMLPCCTPKRLGSVQILYRNTDGTYYDAHVPNLKVLECGCA